MYRPHTDRLYRPRTDHLPTTYGPRTDRLHRPHTDHVPTTYRPSLPTTYRPHTDRSSCSLLPFFTASENRFHSSSLTLQSATTADCVPSFFVAFLIAVYESFKEYTAVETLDGDNKYDAGEHGLQVKSLETRVQSGGHFSKYLQVSYVRPSANSKTDLVPRVSLPCSTNIFKFNHQLNQHRLYSQKCSCTA